MKQILFFLGLSVPLLSFGQLQVNVVQVTTNDLVYDSNTNRIYASIPSANGSNGNSIGIINPNNYMLENTVFIGSEPTVLAISDNGQYIYSGFSGSSTVRRFDVASQTAGVQFSLGSDGSTGSLYVEDIEVMPGSPSTIAISRKNRGFSPRHEGVVIYDTNIMRPTTTPDHTGSNRIEFTGTNSLIGYNNETTEFGLRRMSVNSSGVNVVSVTENVLSGFNLDFIYKNNYLYSFDGKVVDVTTAPFVIGQFTNTRGPVVYDTYYNKVAFASYDSSGNITFKRFNPNTFLLTDSLPISQAFGTVKNIITCGNGCYAFNTTDDKVVILKDSALSISETEMSNDIKVYPNPTADYLYLSSKNKVKDVFVSDLHGRVIRDLKLNDNKIDLGKLPKGLYLANIIDVHGNFKSIKIIKK